MLLVLMATMAATAPPPPRPTLQPAEAPCANALGRAASTSPARSRKLGELPPGRAILAVNKSVGGCPVTVLMERDAGGERRMVPAGDVGRVLTPAGEPLKR
jgi:hypothetical protein